MKLVSGFVRAMRIGVNQSNPNLFEVFAMRTLGFLKRVKVLEPYESVG